MTTKRGKRRRPPAAKPRKPGRAPLRGLLLLLALVATAVLGWIGWTYAGPGPAAPAGVTYVVLEKGSGVAKIADQLADAGVIRSKPLFMAAAKLGGGTLKAGEYEIASRASLARIVAELRAGRVVRHYVTVPEGWTSEMAAEAVTRSPVLTGEAVAPPEGSILPETYEVRRGESREEVLQRMRKAQEDLLAKTWPKRQAGLPFSTQQEALALASIVEKETALPAERPRIAAVYVNRLRQGMRLESDPTTIYGISRGRPLGRGITRSELLDATPYNTYQMGGLPPTPIANPGKAAIEAVLNPPSTNELFFVADGSGGHVFAPTFAEHQKNVARWREVERREAQKREAQKREVDKREAARTQGGGS